MDLRTRLLSRGVLLGLLICMSMNLQAGPITVTVGNANELDGIPFVSGSRYQQVYDASNFATSFLIDTIDFFLADGQSDESLISGATYWVRLSTTSASTNTLDTNFDNNRGADETEFLVINEDLKDRLSGNLLRYNVNPFLYDPAAGSLLIEFQFIAFGTPIFVLPSLFEFELGSTTTTRLSDTFEGGTLGCLDDAGAPLNCGLVTRFSGEMLGRVPTPSTALLLLLGLAFAFRFVSQARA
ncbi:MAG: hypothetical protein AAGI44_06065 [Pseudomonadota bacterium]